MDHIQQISIEVKELLSTAEGGHDWWHIYRVWTNAKEIARGKTLNHTVIELAAILHDIADSKFHNGDESVGPQMAQQLLNKYKIEKSVKDHVLNIIRHMSFKNSLETQTWTSEELKIVQDADRLDAIGAIGIARAFNYGGYKNRAIYDPNLSPLVKMTKEEYKKSSAPTINHFYEKLLKLKDGMHTERGIEMAKKRHAFMKAFLDQFYSEVGEIPQWHK